MEKVFIILTEAEKQSVEGLYNGLKIRPIKIKDEISVLGMIKKKRYILPVQVLIDTRAREIWDKLSRAKIKLLKKEDFPDPDPGDLIL